MTHAPLPFAANAIRAAAGLPAFGPGWVWLVGAGPGDPGLLTLHALNALQQADVVVYDALVDEAVLNLVRPGATVEYAGKRGGKPSPMQRNISLRLIEWARKGKRVLRLKGGDPFLFGRGGEEALALVAAQIPFRIVPGVTSGVGGLAYAGIPATHRDVNHAVTFVTGHMAGGDVPDTINWRALSEGSPVIVIYMGLKHLPRIAGELLAAGRNAHEPVAVISQATTKNQRVLETTLTNAVADVEKSGIEAPALIVVGEAVRLRAGLDWLSAITQGRVLDADPLGKRESDREAG
jgi:uroporphyrin-III C-methyltransferase